ncbi:MAG TPA: amino acid ABC transporter substrate-binding protein [Acetobacteraceae bacterium]|nr:amino acid ABC transporter substrate-binding protein [Acetobacteraceae bacterium]
MRNGIWLFCLALLLATGGAHAQEAPGGVLARIRQDGTVRIAYRVDAPPFSYLDKADTPVGFMIDLCHAVVDNIAQQLGRSSLKITYVAVSAADRFTAIAQGKADLLCESTTETLSRREMVDFSLPTFVDGAGIMIRPGGPGNLQQLAGKKLGVLGGTTTEQELRASLKQAGLTADVVTVKTQAEGMALLGSGKIAAYFADRAALAYFIETGQAPSQALLADNFLSIEPFALALPRGDEDFRLAVDRALSEIYRSGEISTIFTQAFGSQAQPGPALKALYLITGLPE